jgi:hypothetical protein
MNVFQEWREYIDEISPHFVNVAKSHFQKSSGADIILGDHLRKVVDFTPSSPQLDAIIRQLKEKGVEVDMLSGMASIPPTLKQIEASKGRAKPRKMRLGRAIKKYLGSEAAEQWSRESAKLSPYALIFTQHPVDVLRMSDPKALQSCHSKGGRFFHCAMEESLGHGMVVYAIPVHQYVRLLDAFGVKQIEELDDEEIFEDPERNIPGVRPTSRMRIRKLHNSSTNDSVFVPEIEVYGNDIKGLYDAVADHVFDQQKHKWGMENHTRSDWNDDQVQKVRIKPESRSDFVYAQERMLRGVIDNYDRAGRYVHFQKKKPLEWYQQQLQLLQDFEIQSDIQGEGRNGYGGWIVSWDNGLESFKVNHDHVEILSKRNIDHVPNFLEYEVTGGSYEDNPAAILLNSMFKMNIIDPYDLSTPSIPVRSAQYPEFFNPLEKHIRDILDRRRLWGKVRYVMDHGDKRAQLKGAFKASSGFFTQLRRRGVQDFTNIDYDAVGEFIRGELQEVIPLLKHYNVSLEYDSKDRELITYLHPSESDWVDSSEDAGIMIDTLAHFGRNLNNRIRKAFSRLGIIKSPYVTFVNDIRTHLPQWEVNVDDQSVTVEVASPPYHTSIADVIGLAKLDDRAKASCLKYFQYLEQENAPFGRHAFSRSLTREFGLNARDTREFRIDSVVQNSRIISRISLTVPQHINDQHVKEYLYTISTIAKEKEANSMLDKEIASWLQDIFVREKKQINEAFEKVKTWFTAKDELGLGDSPPCPTCAPLHMVTLPVDEEYLPGVMEPPVHANCRCTIEYHYDEIGDEDEFEDERMMQENDVKRSQGRFRAKRKNDKIMKFIEDLLIQYKPNLHTQSWDRYRPLFQKAVNQQNYKSIFDYMISVLNMPHHDSSMYSSDDEFYALFNPETEEAMAYDPQSKRVTMMPLGDLASIIRHDKSRYEPNIGDFEKTSKWLGISGKAGRYRAANDDNLDQDVYEEKNMLNEWRKWMNESSETKEKKDVNEKCDDLEEACDEEMSEQDESPVDYDKMLEEWKDQENLNSFAEEQYINESIQLQVIQELDEASDETFGMFEMAHPMVLNNPFQKSEWRKEFDAWLAEWMEGNG